MTPMNKNVMTAAIPLRRIVAFFACMSIGCCAWTQSLDIDWLQIAGNEIVVHYSIEDDNSFHAYTVNLFSSNDNFAAPLVKLSGDHGNEVKPGKDRQIRWRITEELGQFAGGIELELRAKMYVPFMKMTMFKSKGRYKRGKNYPLVWQSGNPGTQVDIELFRGDTRVHSDRNVQNSGKFDWMVPETAKSGGGYRLKFTNVKSREETFFTESFTIANKIPWVLKIAAVAAVGTGIYMLTSGGVTSSHGEPDLPPIDDELPSN